MSVFNDIYVRALPLLEKKRYSGLSASLKAGSALERHPLEKNLEIQWIQVKAMLQHAYETVPFYKRRFDQAGISIDHLKTPADMSRIPILTREDIRANLEDLWSRKFSRESLLEAATGGTTDTPVP